MATFLKSAILFAIVWPLAASDLRKCDSSVGETVVRLLDSRPNHQPVTVALVHFQQDSCILDNFEMIMHKVDRKIKYTFYTIDGFKNSEILKPKTDITILFAKDNLDYKSFINFAVHNVRRIASEYIIFIANDEQTMRMLFKATHYRIPNILFILVQHSMDEEKQNQRFFIHKPLTKEKFKEIDGFGSFEAIFSSPLDQIERETKIGIDVDTSLAVNEQLMKSFLETMKAPYKIQTSRRNAQILDYMLPTLLAIKNIDLSSHKFPLFKSFHKNMELQHSYPYEWEQFCFLLPTMAKPEVNAINVMKTFRKEIWLYSGIVFVCYIILRHLSKSLEVRINRNNESVPLARSIWTILEITVTGATVMRFRTLFDKIFMTLFILYCFFLMTFFDSSFVSVGISAPGDVILRTVIDVLAQNRTIYAKPILYEISQELFLNSSFKSLFKISKLDTFNYTSNEFYLMSKREIKTILAADKGFSAGSQQPPRWYMVDECLYSIPMVFLFALDSPYRDAFNKFASRIWESGIHQYWEREAKRKAENGTSRFGIPNFLVYDGPIKLNDIWFSFVILGIGLSLSFVVFLLELLVHWAKRYFCNNDTEPAALELQQPIRNNQQQRQLVLRRRTHLGQRRRQGDIGMFNRCCQIV